MIKIKGDLSSTIGFDIVIGNPPYLEAKKLKHISAHLKHYIVYSGTADLSSYFFERGINLCKELGQLNFINTNKFFVTGYGKPLRLHLLNYEIKRIINFEQVEVFENVLVSSVILGLTKQKYNGGLFYYKKFHKLKSKDFVKLFTKGIGEGSSINQKILDEKEWSFADEKNLEIKTTIESNATVLKRIAGVSIFRGVTTGFNPAFIIDEVKKNEILMEDNRNSDMIKPILQGRNIRKWHYGQSGLNLIFTKQGVNIEKYPSIVSHLQSFRKQLEPKIGNNLEGRKPGRYKWYEIQDNTAYYLEFEKSEKIIWGLTADKWAFAYDDKRHYLPSNGYILTSKKIPLKFILAILNSKLLKYYFTFIGIMTAGGAYTLKQSTIQQLPITLPDDYTPFINLTNQILSLKADSINNDVSTLENQLNYLIYDLYKLNNFEIEIIESVD